MANLSEILIIMPDYLHIPMKIHTFAARIIEIKPGFSMKHLISSILNRYKSTPDGHEIFRGMYHEGNAVYTFIPSEERHIFDGDFKVRYNYEKGKFAEAKGTYKNDVKQGHWEFARYGFTTRRSLSVDFEDGQMEGTLECMYQKKGSIQSDYSELKLTVHQGKITGAVTGILNGKEIPADFRDNPQLVSKLDTILDEVISVLLSLAPRGHECQELIF